MAGSTEPSNIKQQQKHTERRRKNENKQKKSKSYSHWILAKSQKMFVYISVFNLFAFHSFFRARVCAVVVESIRVHCINCVTVRWLWTIFAFICVFFFCARTNGTVCSYCKSKGNRCAIGNRCGEKSQIGAKRTIHVANDILHTVPFLKCSTRASDKIAFPWTSNRKIEMAKVIWLPNKPFPSALGKWMGSECVHNDEALEFVCLFTSTFQLVGGWLQQCIEDVNRVWQPTNMTEYVMRCKWNFNDEMPRRGRIYSAQCAWMLVPIRIYVLMH